MHEKVLDILALHGYPDGIVAALAALPDALLDTDGSGEITIATGYKYDKFGNIQKIEEM